MFASIRALSQSLAREFQPKGIHVTYCMVENGMGKTSTLFHLLSKSVSTSINNLTLHGAKSLACLEILLSIVLKIEYCFGMTTEQ